MTNILVIDTSGDACSLALLQAHGTQAERITSVHEVMPMQQAKRMLPAIQSLLLSHSLSFEQLDAIAYGAGPGSFTGLRLASSAAQAIGYALNIPIVPVSSLAALAQTAYMQNGWENVLVAVDGRKNQLYWAPYHLKNEGVMTICGEGELLISPGEARLDAFNGWYGVGDGWGVYRQELAQNGTLPLEISDLQAPRAEAMLALVLQKLDQKRWVKPADALPVYLNPFKR